MLKSRPTAPRLSGKTSTTPGRLTALAPGLGLAGAAALLAMGINRLVPAVSPLLAAIILGAAVGNLTRIGRQVPPTLKDGLAFASRPALRLGIVLLGLQLVLGDIVGLGWPIVLAVITIVAGGIGASLLAGRALGVAPSQTLLIACGFSICGAAAVAGVDGVLAKRRHEETATAIALVVLFGTLMIAFIPGLSALLGLDEVTAGIWAGASIHEVAQVVAAGGILGAAALKVAVVVKLARVLMLAPVLAVVSWQQRRECAEAGQARPPLVPLFVIGFLAMVMLRGTGVVPAAVITGAGLAQTVLLSAAMFALGCSVHRTVLRTAGWRSVALAAIATGVVGAAGLATALLA